MKYRVCMLLIVVFLCSSCRHGDIASVKLLDGVERLIEENPDSAWILLDQMPCPEKLDDGIFARRCMLSCKIMDKFYHGILSVEQLERAGEWYLSRGEPADQVQILIYWGRASAADGDYDKAMSVYTNAIDIAEKNRFGNLLGYIYSNMGDLYDERAMWEQAIKKYEIAADYFKKANNADSYACALRDMGREYALMDSLCCSLKTLLIADSVSVNSENKDVKASIKNSLGNIYFMQGRYEKAKEHFLKALGLGQNRMPNYIAMAEVYIAMDSLQKAKEVLKEMPQDNSEYTYSIKNLSYQICKSEKKYREALTHLEEYAYMIDSIANARNQLKILDIEAKYNNLKIKDKARELETRQHRYMIGLSICVLLLLLGTLEYCLYRRRAKEKIEIKQTELNKKNAELLNLSLELEQKKKLLVTICQKDEEYDKLQKEIEILLACYRKLQRKVIVDSPIYNELLSLSKTQKKSENRKSLITEKQWKLIKKEITLIYPKLYGYVYDLCPDLSEQDFQYCCFYLYGFDSNEEARLLSISPDSVRTKRLRLRRRLGISLPSQVSLYEYLMEKISSEEK